MKLFTTSIMFALMFHGVLGQSAYINGTPISVVSSSTLAISDSVDVGAYPSHISSTADGKYMFVSTFFDVHVIDVSDNSISSTITGLNGKFEAATSEDYMYGISGTQFYSVDLSDNSVDSISLPATDRLQHRPGTDEIWVTADSVVHVVDVSSGMSLSTTFTTGTSAYDGSEVRFSADATTAIKMNWNSKTVAKIDAANKSVTSTLDMSFVPNLSGVEVAADGDFAFISCSNNNKVYKIDVSTMTISDSAAMPRAPFGMYRHPNDGKLWVVGHFDHVVYVVDPSDLSVEDSVLVPGDPHIVEFMNAPVGIQQHFSNDGLRIYPNPARDHFVIESDKVGSSWSLIDMKGSTVRMGRISGSNTRVSLNALESGLYLLRSGGSTQSVVVE